MPGVSAVQMGEDMYQPSDYKTLKEAPAAAAASTGNRKLAQAWAAPAPAGDVIIDGASYTKVSGK